MNSKVLILVDADVVIHLFKAEKISLLNELYPGRLRMLDIVCKELLNNRTVKKVVENLFRYNQVEEIVFPTSSNPQMLNEFTRLKNKIKGRGERACLLYCKYYKHIIASSNTRDIIPFCGEFSIAYLTTLDIFTIALNRGKITSAEANQFIKKILNGSYLCCNTIEEHIKKHFKKEKLIY